MEHHKHALHIEPALESAVIESLEGLVFKRGEGNPQSPKFTRWYDHYVQGTENSFTHFVRVDFDLIDVRLMVELTKTSTLSMGIRVSSCEEDKGDVFDKDLGFWTTSMKDFKEELYYAVLSHLIKREPDGAVLV
jgi:hypothetical protein